MTAHTPCFDPDPAPVYTPWWALAVVGLGASIAPLDFAVNVAFPAISQAFALPPQDIRWVALCYVMTYGSLMLGCGALGDRWGHLRIFRWGLWLSLLSLVLCALSATYAWLLAGRVLQGVAVALTLSCAPALVLAAMGAGQRTRALAIHGSMSAMAGMLAPLAGGLSMIWWDWPGVFGFRVPVVLLALAGLPLLARALQGAAKSYPNGVAGPSAWTSSGLSRLITRFHQTPDFAWLNGFSVVVQFCSFAVILLLPFYLGPVHGWGSVEVGALLTVWAGGVLLGSLGVPRWLGRMSVGRLLDVAMWGVALGLGLTGLWTDQLNWPWMAAALGLQGVALGVFQVAYADQVVASLPDTDRGVSGSLTWVTRTVGVVGGALVWLWLMDGLYVRAQLAGFDHAQASAAAVMGSLQWAAALAALTAAWRVWQSRH
jgi:MFS family permease